MAPSNPAFRFPDCPDCLEPVHSTDLDEGGVYSTSDGPGVARARASAVAGDPAVGPRLAGAPELDRLTLHPCGHTLTGPAVWVFNLEAARLTFPDFRIDVTVTVPAPFTGNDAPAVYTLSAVAGVDDLAAMQVPHPLVTRLRGLFNLAEQALPEWCPPATAATRRAAA